MKRLDPDSHSTDFQVRLFWLLQQGTVLMERKGTLSSPDWQITCNGITARSCALSHALDLVIREVEDVPR